MIAAQQAQQLCNTGCGYPVDPNDVARLTEQARAAVPQYWHDEFAAAGAPATPEGRCLECAGEWLVDLENYRDEYRCDGHCSPYDNCMCQLMLPEDEY
jgi:hypothetical protein